MPALPALPASPLNSFPFTHLQLDPIAYTLLHHPSSANHTRLPKCPAIAPLLSLYRNDKKTLIVHLLPVEEFAVPDAGVRPAYSSMEDFEKTPQAFLMVLEEAGVQWKSLGKETMDLEERVEKVLRWMREVDAR
jgi:hypothetical protein